MNRAREKATRLMQIEELLWAHPEGLTRAEIARRVQVDRSVITKYLDKDNLPRSIYVDEGDGGRLKVDRSASLARTSFTLHETLALHLATRLLAQSTDKQNPHAASALRKLGSALQRLDERIGRHLLLSADVMDQDATRSDATYLEVLERLTEAWSTGHKLFVQYQKPDGAEREYTFSPYMLEPYAAGRATYMIGVAEPPGSLYTLKVERMRTAKILPDTYAIPATFDPGDAMRSAWGIWMSEGEPEEVVLRFDPEVVKRVQETRWHRAEQKEEEADGSLIWRARIAAPREMLPWVRGWGAAVEVLAPAWLRAELTTEATRLFELYVGRE